MALKLENGELFERWPVFVEENKVQVVKLIVDAENPDGWYHAERDNYGIKFSEAQLIPLRAVLVGRARKVPDSHNVDNWWKNFELAEPPADAKPTILFQKQ